MATGRPAPLREGKHMLGKEIAHDVGQQTGVRVMRDATHGTVVESSFQAAGTLLGVHTQDIGTYISWPVADGRLQGKGRGVIMGEKGEMATWEATGAGQLKPDGSAEYRGAIYFTSQTPKLSALNGTCCVFEFSADAGGKTESKTFLWE